MKTFFQGWRESVVCLDVVHKSSVTSNLGGVEDDQESGTRSLLLIGDIGVPSNAAVAAGEEGIEFTLAAIAIYKVDLWVAFWGTAGLSCCVSTVTKR